MPYLFCEATLKQVMHKSKRKMYAHARIANIYLEKSLEEIFIFRLIATSHNKKHKYNIKELISPSFCFIGDLFHSNLFHDLG